MSVKFTTIRTRTVITGSDVFLSIGPLVACDRGTCRVEDLSTFQDLDALAEALDKQSVLYVEFLKYLDDSHSNLTLCKCMLVGFMKRG